MQEGLRTLLTRHALASATLDDLLLALLDGFATTVNSTRSGQQSPRPSHVLLITSYLVAAVHYGPGAFQSRVHTLSFSMSKSSKDLKAIWSGTATGALQQLRANSTLFSDSDADALTLLRTWITQPGYPLLNLSDSNVAEQARFYAYGSSVRTDAYTSTSNGSWFVPLQVGPLESASSNPLSAGGGLATAGSGNAGATWVELLQQPRIALNSTGPVINKGATRYYRSALHVCFQQCCEVVVTTSRCVAVVQPCDMHLTVS